MDSNKILFEKNWDIFVLTGMPWHEIKALEDNDREFMYEKSIQAKERAIEQQKKRDEYLAKTDNGND